MTEERDNDENLFSPLADADSPANFLLQLQPWFQAVFAGLEEDKVKQEHKILEAKGNLSGTGGCGREERETRERVGLERKVAIKSRVATVVRSPH